MRVSYSVGARFAGGGIGNTAYRAVQGLYRHDMLHLLLCGSYRSTEIPTNRIRTLGLLSRILRKLATYDTTRQVTYLHDVLYDRWAAYNLDQCDIFHGWGNFSLRTLHRATALGATTIVERASSHPLYQAKLLREEYARWGLRFRTPAAALKRAVEELKQADYVLIPSDFVRRSFLDYGFVEEQLLQIPFGVDIRRFHPLRDRSSHPFRVLYLGQVSLQKGIPYLLDAWRQLGWQDAELWMAGRPDREIEALISPDRSLPGATWFGYVSDPVRLFQQADVFVFPSLQEGSALVTYEALACGLPVVTTQNAGSIVRHGEDGYIVPIRDRDALAARLDELRGNDQLRTKMGAVARRQAELYTWDRYQSALTSSFTELHRRDKRSQ